MAELAEGFVASAAVLPSMRAELRMHLAPLAEAFGADPADQLTPRRLAEWRDGLCRLARADGQPRYTRRYVVRMLASVERCYRWGAETERVPDLTVLLNGDFLTGTLHGLERHADSPNIVRSVLACGDLLALALRDLAAAFPAVRVIGVSGNHGRLPDDRKVPTKDPTRSWDYLAFSIARRRLEGQRNIDWHLPAAYGSVFEVAGHQCYMAHGNFIPNNLGVVGYGVRRFTSALASNLGAAGKPLRYAFFGHWHASSSAEFAGVEAFIGPSLIGTQEYGFLAGGSVNRSAQELHLFDRDLGHVTRERLYGDGPGYSGTYEVQV